VVERQRILEGDVSWQAILGHINFSEGRPEPRFQKQLNDAYRLLAERSSTDPVPALAKLLPQHLRDLHASGAAAFREIRQAEAVLDLVFTQVLPAYRKHHADLLAHQSERDLFQPFFLARAFEAVLAQGGPWEEKQRVADGALNRLNDYVGYRPIPTLESRRRGEIYDHERLAAIPLYLRGAGVAWGRYHDLVVGALEILNHSDANIRAEAHFDPELLSELAFDPRAYDHNHPANRRPNYMFGEWDPHCIDNQGHYRRFVVRQLTLEALLQRVEDAKDGAPDEYLWEASAVLAGIVLMAAGTTGSGPTFYDSTVTFSKLVPKIAAYRDAFYRQLLAKVPGRHGERLRQEAIDTKQPFGGIRRHLNQALARHRATQLQQRQLSLLFAEMGYPEVSRQQAARIPVPSLRLQSEVLIRVSLGFRHAKRGELKEGAALLPEAEALIQRGIACGAFVDPWNILGFQGLYPLSNAREDSIHDHRVDELIYLVERVLDFYARLLGEAAAAGDEAMSNQLRPAMRRLAGWWDRFASISVADVRRLHATEAADAAEHVATALARWRQQGEASTGLAFWKKYLNEFQSPKAFAQVVEALLEKRDHQAALALLMSWLSQVEQVPLEDGIYSFPALARRWLLAVTNPPAKAEGEGPVAEVDFGLVQKFFDYLEANADEYWDVPDLGLASPTEVNAKEDEEENPYEAAYEGVVYRDSGDDGHEGGLLDDERSLDKDFSLEEEVPRLEKRLRFLATLAQLWKIAARHVAKMQSPAKVDSWQDWLKRAANNRRRLIGLLQAIHQCNVPEPLSSFDSMLEYERRNDLKERLLEIGIGTTLETTMAVLALLALADDPEASGVTDLIGDKNSSAPEWLAWFVRLEQALRQGNAGRAQELLPQFVFSFQNEPLLIVPLSGGGRPTAILQTRIAQAVLRMLLKNVPRLGLLRETHELLRTIRTMEQSQPSQGSARRVTEYERFFRWGYQGVMECLVESAPAWGAEAGSDRQLVEWLKAVTQPFSRLWSEHSGWLQLSSLERIGGEENWETLREFIKRYGRDLFHAKFLTLDNLRGILHRGIATYLDKLREQPDPQHPVRLLDDLGSKITLEEAVRQMDLVLHALIENYEEFKDFTATTALAAYGENLHVLLDFLRVKTRYDRLAWQHRPLVWAHQVLVRRGRSGAALLWEKAFSLLTAPLADEQLAQLAQVEAKHAIQLRTVNDRLRERFVKPLAIDRLCMLVAPCIEEARKGGSGPSLAQFLEELGPHAANPSGSGLDLPNWLERLDQEVRRVRSERVTGIDPSRDAVQVPRKQLTLEQVQRQLAEWDQQAAPPAEKPASGEPEA
jgi:hypothetical protein